MIRTDLLSFLLFIHYKTIRREKRGGSGRRDVGRGGGDGSGGGLKGRGDAAALRKIGGSERECRGRGGGGVSMSGGGIA